MAKIQKINFKYRVNSFNCNFCLKDLFYSNIGLFNEFTYILLFVNQVGPVNPTGAEERTYHHQAPRNIYMPRKMYPVENYAQPNHNT